MDVPQPMQEEQPPFAAFDRAALGAALILEGEDCRDPLRRATHGIGAEVTHVIVVHRGEAGAVADGVADEIGRHGGLGHFGSTKRRSRPSVPAQPGKMVGC